jgi:hypothetical protein
MKDPLAVLALLRGGRDLGDSEEESWARSVQVRERVREEDSTLAGAGLAEGTTDDTLDTSAAELTEAPLF